ncbi:MAG: exo-beta-N-acetylmuramidase NamZ domain-containing protein, partial [Flavobacteriaceae bacterium]
ITDTEEFVTKTSTVYLEEKHLVDFLIENKINIQKIYAPEHGFRGTADAGELIKDGKDTKTGLPIISLYGNNKKPTKEQLSGIDIMIFDLQDVGARFYTYISSLHYLMEACAQNNIPLIVLDRPNPNGNIIDGPTLEKEHTSFVGMHPIPVLHGMTIGEYAQMINGEKWLKNGIQCDLTVIECVNYKRDMDYSLPIPPSPNLPNDKSISLYASLCFFEGTNVSVGRGTDKQFQVFGSPFLKNMNFKFIPKPNLGAKDPMHNGKECLGKDLSQEKNIERLELKWLIEAYNNTQDKNKFFNNFFVKLAGTKKLQQQIEQGLSEDEIRKTWEEDLQKFKEIRKKYLIYN